VNWFSFGQRSSWNAELFAANPESVRGERYVVVVINFHGCFQFSAALRNASILSIFGSFTILPRLALSKMASMIR
jgi:hypothetical protein